jgi:phosphatidylethanolamine-binding protein (PEBP) family uncharacterized protein
MNLQILNFYNEKTQITKKYFCHKNGGKNKSPIVKWKDIPDASSYSLIMEDPKSIHGNTIHWFIPTIINDKIEYGLNSYNKFGWYGPCPPPNTGIHKYIFIVYSLNKIIEFNTKKKIKSSTHYEYLLKKNNVKILYKEIKCFYYDTNKTT